MYSEKIYETNKALKSTVTAKFLNPTSSHMSMVRSALCERALLSFMATSVIFGNEKHPHPHQIPSPTSIPYIDAVAEPVSQNFCV